MTVPWVVAILAFVLAAALIKDFSEGDNVLDVLKSLPARGYPSELLTSLKVNSEYTPLGGPQAGRGSYIATYHLHNSPIPKTLREAVTPPPDARVTEGSTLYPDDLGSFSSTFKGKNCEVEAKVQRGVPYKSDRINVLQLRAAC